MYIGVVLGDGAGRDDVSRCKNEIKHVEEDGIKKVGTKETRLVDYWTTRDFNWLTGGIQAGN